MRWATRMAAVAAVAGLASALSVGAAGAATLDCTTGSCTGAVSSFVEDGATYYNFSGALWSLSDQQSTGTGVIDSFVRISGNTDVVDGHNTSKRPLLNDENSAPPFTHDIPLDIVPIVDIGGNLYYEFLLDINQTNEDPFLSLDKLILCTSETGEQAAANACPTAEIEYDLDNPVDDTVLLNYAINSGSGSGDLFVYIPVGNFTAEDANDFVYLYSSFGATHNNNDGFEEWAIRTTEPISPIPEPASLLLFGSGLAGLGSMARKRFNRKTPKQ